MVSGPVECRLDTDTCWNLETSQQVRHLVWIVAYLFLKVFGAGYALNSCGHMFVVKTHTKQIESG